MYWIDPKKLDQLREEDEDSPEARSAVRELEVFGDIIKYMEKTREEITRDGNITHINIPQLPIRISSIEKKRFAATIQANHIFKRNLTRVSKRYMFRCPLPGCAGAPINQRSAKRALGPHCRMYHATGQMRFAFRAQGKKDWEVFL